MTVRILIVLSFLLAAGPAMLAQDKKIELIPFVAYTLSEGIDFNAADIGTGQIVNKLTPKSGFTYGFQVDLLAGENFAMGFLFSDQLSKLEIGLQGGGKEDLTDMNVRNYHGILTYNFGEGRDPVRPYFFGGLGATQYSPDDINGNSVESSTRFSTTWGGGVKAYASEHVGFRLGGRWTPTYINSDPAGIWCSPYWPFQCWVVNDANYSHQFQFDGGVILTF